MSIDNIAKSPTPTELVETVNKMIEQLNVTKGLAIGDFVMSMRTDVPEGRIRPDGTEYPAAFNQDLWDNYITTGKLPTCTYAQWQTLYSQYGNVGIIGVDAVNKKWKAPLIADGTFVAMALNGTIGEFFEAALPNIEATLNNGPFGNQPVSVVNGATWSGALWYENRVSVANAAGSGAGVGYYTEHFDASRSNPIYGKSNTVTPNHIRYPLLMVIGNTSVMASEIQYSEFMAALGNKANADLTNLSSVANLVIQNAMLPDYSALIELPLDVTEKTYTALVNGYLVGEVAAAQVVNGCYIMIDDIYICRGVPNNQYYIVTKNVFAFTAAGSVIKYKNGFNYNTGASSGKLYFVPLKGGI